MSDALPSLHTNSPLSEPQRLALLTMRRSELSKAVLAELARAGTPGPQGRHFYEVARLGLAARSPKGSFHILSPRGRFVADRIGREIARERGLHVIDYDLGGPGRAACARCACGWAAFRTRAVGSYLISLAQDAAFHMARVAGEAKLKPVPIASVASAFKQKTPSTPIRQGGNRGADHSDPGLLPALPAHHPAVHHRAASGAR